MWSAMGPAMAIVDDAALKARLSPLAYKVTREAATERPFTGEHLKEHRAGDFACVCCGARLFDSEGKFDSGTGWPSFWRPSDGAPIDEREDHALFMKRVEVRCAACDAHLGHVFEDGPPPTGMRYCINSVALTFAPR